MISQATAVHSQNWCFWMILAKCQFDEYWFPQTPSFSILALLSFRDHFCVHGSLQPGFYNTGHLTKVMLQKNWFHLTIKISIVIKGGPHNNHHNLWSNRHFRAFSPILRINIFRRLKSYELFRFGPWRFLFLPTLIPTSDLKLVFLLKKNYNNN